MSSNLFSNHPLLVISLLSLLAYLAYRLILHFALLWLSSSPLADSLFNALRRFFSPNLYEHSPNLSRSLSHSHSPASPSPSLKTQPFSSPKTPSSPSLASQPQSLSPAPSLNPFPNPTNLQNLPSAVQKPLLSSNNHSPLPTLAVSHSTPSSPSTSFNLFCRKSSLFKGDSFIRGTIGG